MSKKTVKVMFVCLGNICRSPLAEALFHHEARAMGVDHHLEVASSGTGDWHVGHPADRRMRRTAGGSGVSLEGHRAQQFRSAHFEEYDYIFVMDKNNLHDVLYLDLGDRYGSKVRLFREFDPEPGDYQVPDPYFGGPDGFDGVYAIVQRTARTILKRIIEEHGFTAARQVDRPA